MSVRRQTLEEWFTDHQLQRIGRDHFHIPVGLNVDVTAVHHAWEAAGKRLPVTAMVIKALALTAREHPECNRTVFRTSLGTWVVDFEHTDVNVPVMIEHEGRSVLSAVVIHDAADKSVAAIHQEVREASQRDLSALPIGRHFIANRNTWFNRTKLRLVHWAVWNLPWAFERKRGGGLAVSSLIGAASDTLDITAVSRGPHVLNVGVWTLRETDGRQLLKLGIGYDHSGLGGQAMFRVMSTLDAVLRGDRFEGELAPGP